jgi:hypothetical protein
MAGISRNIRSHTQPHQIQDDNYLYTDQKRRTTHQKQNCKTLYADLPDLADQRL